MLRLRDVVLDCTNPRELAEFYREFLGLTYRPGDEPPSADDWLVLRTADGVPQLAFQRVDQLTPPTWPEPTIPQQLHLDLTVESTEELIAEHNRALALGATMLQDRINNPEEPLRVYADPAGHPFCIFVA
jgi:hypothetical protein